mmetsp:Transcript_39201/g.98156  ORF Transcript_39201/g.98156 Transcript_39201/m.98156 type:complete len:103 (-) Transcript_39201:108-416(-)
MGATSPRGVWKGAHTLTGGQLPLPPLFPALLAAPASLLTPPPAAPTGGNQREIDRARAQARDAKHAKGGKADGLTPQQRKEKDAAALAEKIKKKQESAAAGS